MCELLLSLGQVAEARDYAERGMVYANEGGSTFERIFSLTTQASVLHQAGQLNEATAAFHEAEAMQKEREPQNPLLYSQAGFQYCALLLVKNDVTEAQRRTRQTLKWATDGDLSLLTIALDHLTLGCAEMALALGGEGGDFTEAYGHLNTAVDTLRKAQLQDHLVRSLLARAEYYFVQADFALGQRDLEEAWEIASRGEMLLFICDAHLACARLMAAMASAGVAIDKNALAPDSPFMLFLEDSDDSWKDCALRTARGHIEEAGRIIEETGYHRRDPEIPLETARVEALAGNVDLGREELEKAKLLIDEMGCHCWDRDAAEIGEMLGT